MDRTKAKAFFIIIGIVTVIIAILIIAVLASNDKDDTKNFPTYSKIDVDEDEIENPESVNYKELKKKLENDYNFSKEVLISNYNHVNFTSADLEKMLWYYIYAVELNNTKYMSKHDKKEYYFCLREKYFINSFEELYGVKITNYLDYVDGYINYVTQESGKYCFHYGNVAREYNYEVKVFVDGLSMKDKVITANIYLYEYYTTYTVKEIETIQELTNAINDNNSNEANRIVKENLNGKVTHKQLNFKINNNADFFKYQILMSKKLDY